MVYVIDCGHALTTAGKRSPDHRFFEYEYNRVIGRRVAEQLNKLGIKNFFTYPIDEYYDLSLSSRAENCNKIAKECGVGNTLLISIHSNAAGNGKEWKSAKGWSVFTTKGATKSDRYAEIFWEEARKVCAKYGRTTRQDTSDGDHDWEENFTVIYKTICPAILIEEFFYDNEEECAWLLSEEGKQACTEIIVNAIKRIEGIA
jgi:N-acetylmuramoyl-L-alanine amidase